MSIAELVLLVVLISLILFLALRPRRLIFDPDNDVTARWWMRALFLAIAANLTYSAFIYWSRL